MKTSWKLIPKILSGEKTIESRWYRTRRLPWNHIKAGDTIYFKNSGQPVIASAEVDQVLQFEFKDASEAQKIVDKYGKYICLVNNDVMNWGPIPKYAVLIFLKNQKPVKPFNINKTGFGSSTAWITVPNIKTIKKLP